MGRSLLLFARQRSLELGYGGRLGLHALRRLLASFRDITLVMVNVRGQTYAHLSELTSLQRRILQALNFPVSIYTRLGTESKEPP